MSYTLIDKAQECLEKIDHTVCLAFNRDNKAIFNQDEYEHIDCASIEEFVECYDTVAKCLEETASSYFILKEIFKSACKINSYAGSQTVEITLNDESLKKVKEILDAK